MCSGQQTLNTDSLYLGMYNLIIKDVDKHYNHFGRDIVLTILSQGYDCYTQKNNFKLHELTNTFSFTITNQQKLLSYLEKEYRVVVEPSMSVKEFHIFWGSAEVLATLDKKNRNKYSFVMGVGKMIKKSDNDYYVLVNITKKIVSDEQKKGISYYQHIQINNNGFIELKEKQKIALCFCSYFSKF